MARIFISYRRNDAPGTARRLADDLRSRWGPAQVVGDPEVQHGAAFRYEPASADVVLAVIGPRWAAATTPEGRLRLDEPADPVRVELEQALARDDVLVLPVLVEGARLPSASELPPSLQGLTRIHGLELADSRWDYDVGLLSEFLQRRAPAPPAAPAEAHTPDTPAPMHSRPPGPPVGDDDDDPWWRRPFRRGRRSGER